METGERASVKAAIAAYSVGRTHPSSIMFDPHRSGSVTASRGGVLMDLEMTRKMKIIQFPANIDKFTGFFGKFLKKNWRGYNG